MNLSAGSGADGEGTRAPLVVGADTVGEWRACWVSRVGPSHDAAGSPREDAIAVLAGDGVMVAAVSDGHGMRRAFRAHVGAELAVKAALELATSSRRAWAGRRVDEEGAARWLADTFTADLLTRWRALVAEDQAARPFSLEELAAAGYRPSGARSQDEGVDAVDRIDSLEPLGAADALVAYGATLLVAMADAHRVLTWQIGDGDLLYAPAGQSCTPAVRGDPELSGNRTTSLCLPGAQRHARSAVLRLDGRPTVLVLASDGFGNAMVAEDWQQRLGADLHDSLATVGFDAVADRLPGWADEAATASGDDVSVVVLATGSKRAGTVDDSVGADLVPPDAPSEPGPSLPEGAVTGRGTSRSARRRRAWLVVVVALGIAGAVAAGLALRSRPGGVPTPTLPVPPSVQVTSTSPSVASPTPTGGGSPRGGPSGTPGTQPATLGRG